MDLCTHVNSVFEEKMEEHERERRGGGAAQGTRADAMDVDGVQRKGKKEVYDEEEEEEDEDDE